MSRGYIAECTGNLRSHTWLTHLMQGLADMRASFPPYRIKMVEPIKQTSTRYRSRRLEEVGYNLFLLDAVDVSIDLLTDSGTGAMSQEQWAGLMRGDESYAGSRSFHALRRSVHDLFGYEYVIPAHQGRGAENVLFTALIEPGQYVPGNMHFDTTRAHIQLKGGKGVNLPVKEALDPDSPHPFKGNIDVAELDRFLHEHRGQVPLVVLTLTCNSGGGQPVSLANVREVRDVCRRHSVLLFLDAARIAENAYFVKAREPSCREMSVKEIVGKAAECADGCLMSAKKDGLANIGGFVALSDRELYEKLVPIAVAFEGFPTYGGLAGRDMEAIAVGLHEVVDELYLRERIGQIQALGKQMEKAGVPLIKPFGGHAVYIDMRRFLPHVPPVHFPGQAFCVELYRTAGVRAVEVGSLLAGRDPDTGENLKPELETVRMAVPRRTYTDRHLMYAADAVAELWRRRDRITGVKLVYEPPVLRHFTARFDVLNRS